MDEGLVNKVAESGLISIDLEEYYPKEDLAVFDMKDHLFMGLILKEKEFRAAIKSLDVTPFTGRSVALFCSADAIIPVWAYMLVASVLQPVAKELVFAPEAAAKEQILLRRIAQLDPMQFNDKRVVIKGCGELKIPDSAYISITERLRPVVKSIMYGEPCSTVPVYKKKI